MEGRRETLLSAGCSLLLLILAAATAVGSESPPCRLEDCPHFSAIRYHEELGCVRNDGASGCCPTSYNCSSLLSLDKTKCHYRGEVYEPRSVIREEIKALCIPSCYCVEHDWREARFHCGHIDCRQYLDFSPPKPGCFKTYSLDQCCSTGVHCVNATGGGQVAECVYNGKTYLEGQYIDVHENDCRTCVCQAGFNGTLDGPWCRKFSCDYVLRRRPSELASCAPVFLNNTSKCCSRSWQCPSANDTIVRHSEPPTENEQHCKFGDHRLKIGDEVRLSGTPCFKCTCYVPPFITCEQFPDPQCVAQTK